MKLLGEDLLELLVLNVVQLMEDRLRKNLIWQCLAQIVFRSLCDEEAVGTHSLHNSLVVLFLYPLDGLIYSCILKNHLLHMISWDRHPLGDQVSNLRGFLLLVSLDSALLRLERRLPLDSFGCLVLLRGGTVRGAVVDCFLAVIQLVVKLIQEPTADLLVLSKQN